MMCAYFPSSLEPLLVLWVALVRDCAISRHLNLYFHVIMKKYIYFLTFSLSEILIDTLQ